MANPSYTAIGIKGESITVTLRGETVTIAADAPNYNDLIEAVRRRAPDDEVAKMLTPAKQIEVVAKQAGFEIRVKTETDSVAVFFNGKELDSKVGTLIIEHYRAGHDFTAIKNFLIKAMSNRDAKEVDVLYDFIMLNKLPLHPDGDFLSFKATRKDGYDKHTGTVKYAIGEYLHVQNANPNKSTQCGTGLHIGGPSYVQRYGNSQDAYFILKVNPADAIFYRPNVNDGKMRVSKVFVYAQVSKPDDLAGFLPFMVVASPEGDALEEVAKSAPISEKTEGQTSKVAKQKAVGKGKKERKKVKAAKKDQTFVVTKKSGKEFTAKDGKTYTAKEIIDGVAAKGQRGFSAATSVPRTTLQMWLEKING